MTTQSASIRNPLIHTQFFSPEERSRRLRGSRRLRSVLTYGFVTVAFGLALSDFCHLALAPASGPAVSAGQYAQGRQAVNP
jgi:hypothetical protein